MAEPQDIWAQLKIKRQICYDHVVIMVLKIWNNHPAIMVCFQIIEILIWTSTIGLTNRWFYFTNVLCCPFQFNASINETFMCVYPQVYSLLCVVGYIWQPLVKCPKVLNSSAADAFQNYFLLKGRIAIMHQSEGALIQHSAV